MDEGTARENEKKRENDREREKKGPHKLNFVDERKKRGLGYKAHK